MNNEKGGCYNDCYAAKSAKLYGYDFSKTVLRNFENEIHRRSIIRKINNVSLDFIRMGTSGDPSEDWEHTINIIKSIDKCNKEIVIITKHWTNLNEVQLKYLSTVNVCINTSVSALDKTEILENGLNQYARIKPYCKSILRVVSCDFNKENETGNRLSNIQEYIFKNESVLDTVLRVNKNNPLVKNKIINVSDSTFLGKKSVISKYNKSTYFGKCSTCFEMCGLNIKKSDLLETTKKGISKQMKIFKR